MATLDDIAFSLSQLDAQELSHLQSINPSAIWDDEESQVNDFKLS
jgi:hypothetical protein